MNRQINVQLGVYATNYAAINTAYYSLSSSVSVNPALEIDIYTLMQASQEFTSYVNQYGIYRFKAISLRVVPTTSTNVSLVDIPPIFLDLTIGQTNITDPTSIASSDHATEVKLNSLGDRMTATNYLLPSILIGKNGYPCGGSQAWLSTKSASPIGAISMGLGYYFTPSFSTASTVTYRMACVDVIFDVDFAMPVRAV